MLPSTDAEPAGDAAKIAKAPLSGRHSPYIRLLVGAALALAFWLLLPQLPKDQTVIFSLGPDARRLAQLEVQWDGLDNDHEGHLTLNFPSPTPERVVRQFRLTDGKYSFRITALTRDAASRRTELTRQVTLDGSTLILHVQELTH